MLLSTKTSKHTISLSQTRNLFAGNCMVKDCRIVMNTRLKVSDYQAIKPSYDFRRSLYQRVKEIKRVFV